MSRVESFVQEQHGMAPPHPFSSVSEPSYDTSNEVPWEFIRGPTPEPLMEHPFWNFSRASTGRFSRQQSRSQWKGKQPQRDHNQYMFDNDEEVAFYRLAHEQRLSACLNTLRRIYSSLRSQHTQAQQRLEDAERLISQTSWDLFFQNPHEFIQSEMPLLPTGTINMTTLLPAQFSGHPENWLRSLSCLPLMWEDEGTMRESAERLESQLEYVAALIDMGSREQAAILRGGNPMVDQHRRAFSCSARYGRHERFGDTDAGPPHISGHAAGVGNNTSNASSAFANWPMRRKTPVNGNDASNRLGHEGVPTNLQAIAETLRELTPQELLQVLRAADAADTADASS